MTAPSLSEINAIHELLKAEMIAVEAYQLLARLIDYGLSKEEAIADVREWLRRRG